MSLQKKLRRCLALALFILCLNFTLITQHAQEPGGGGGRRGNLREFLGLGPAPDPAAAKKGEPLYLENCSGCHGKDARGAQAPGLTRMPLVLHDYMTRRRSRRDMAVAAVATSIRVRRFLRWTFAPAR